MQKRCRDAPYQNCRQLVQEQIDKLNALDIEWNTRSTKKSKQGSRPSSKTPRSVSPNDPVGELAHSSHSLLQNLRQGNKEISTNDDSLENQINKNVTTSNSLWEEEGFACNVHKVCADKTTQEIGFILLPSRSSSTFADARRNIMFSIAPTFLSAGEWEFRVPNFGPIGAPQEDSLGSLWSFLSTEDPDGSFSTYGDAQLFLAENDGGLVCSGQK